LNKVFKIKMFICFNTMYYNSRNSQFLINNIVSAIKNTDLKDSNIIDSSLI
jgi:hypothetical protein